MKIIIGNDHGGFELKGKLVEYLEKRGIAVTNIGSDSTEIVRYPYYAIKVGKSVASGEYDRGILICSTGIGMSIVANRIKGVRAALCTTSYTGKMTAAHNNSNILCLGGKCIGEFEAVDILEQWLNTPYMGGRHDISLGVLQEFETSPEDFPSDICM